MNAVATTGLLVAAIRAEESARTENRLFDDPFAATLAGDAGRTVLAQYRAAVGPSIPIIEVRTRYFDEALLAAEARGSRQFVILAAGMDARAYRLPWQPGTHVFEVDQAAVIAAKAAELSDATPRCARVAIGVDLANDWPSALVAAGFDRNAKATWLVEGLLQYLDATIVEALFARIDALSAKDSTLLYDVVGTRLLGAPFLGATLRFMKELGAPWQFGTDDPAALVSSRGWIATAIDPASVGNQWQRWPFPAAPMHVPNLPRGYLVEAIKR